VRRFLKHVSAVWVVNATNGILGVVFVPLAVSRLGMEGYGLFSIYTVLSGYMILAELGIGTNLQRLLASNPDENWRRQQLQTVLGLYVVMCVLALSLLPALVYLVPRFIFPVAPEARSLVARITIFAVLEYVMGVPTSVIQNACVADERFGRYARFALASGAVRYGLMFSAVLVFSRPDYVVGLIIARRIVDAPLAYSLMGRLPAGAWRPRFAMPELAAILGHSSVLSIAQVFQVSVVALGAIMVNWFFGIRQLGVYRAAFDLASKVWFFSNTIGVVLFPKFVRMLSRSDERLRLGRLLPDTLVGSWAAFALLAIGGALAGPVALPVIGLAHPEVVTLFVVLFAGVSLNAHANTAYAFMLAAGQYLRAVLLSVLSLGLLVGIFVGTSRTVGTLAIGWAWIGSQSVYAFAADLTALQLAGVSLQPLRDLFGRLAMLGAVGLGVLSGLQHIPAAGGLVGLGVITFVLLKRGNELRSALARS
jgi:O-antigen/teichoic acid export membrane protein